MMYLLFAFLFPLLAGCFYVYLSRPSITPRATTSHWVTLSSLDDSETVNKLFHLFFARLLLLATNYTSFTFSIKLQIDANTVRSSRIAPHRT